MMTMDVSKTEPSTGGGGGGSQQNNPSSQLCAGCGKHIQDRYLLRALDLLWHEDCLKCGCCDCRLGEVGSTLYTKGNLILCKRDYLRLFGYTGQCAACNKVIPAFEMVMRARSNVYHLECFACQQCNHRFCVGDRFYLCENKILCEYDYEERLVFASMANHPMLKRHATNISQTQQQQQQVQQQQQQQQQQQGHNLMSLGPPSASSAVTPSNGMTLSVNGQRTNGDHNNNTGPSTPNSGPPSFGTPAHMKATLGTSS